MPPPSDQEFLQALLDVEAALATAEAECRLIPASAVADIRAAARAESYDARAIDNAGVRDGNIVIPLVRALTEAVAKRNPESARHVHRGATSQDILDTAVVMRLRRAHSAIHDDLLRAMRAASTLARTHASTPMPGRTWLQHASPTSFGLKAAGWLDLLGRSRARLSEAVDRAQVLQLGGASGTLASLGNDGPAVAAAMARALDLRLPAMPWHTQRDRVAEAAAALGITCGALGKVGRDLSLLAQSEVAEATEPGGGGSSSMPHKQNPVRAVSAIAASIQAPGLVSTILAAMPQEHERAAGGWQAEWQPLAELISITRGSSAAIADALAGLRVDPAAMQAHLASRGGVAMAESLSVALLPHVGRTDSMKLVERLVRLADESARPLREVAIDDPEVARHLSRKDIEHALEPGNFLGSASHFIDRVLREWEM